jgi:hypothetical protein
MFSVYESFAVSILLIKIHFHEISYYKGGHDAEELAEFVKDVLRPTVVELTSSNFNQLLSNKPEVNVCSQQSSESCKPVSTFLFLAESTEAGIFMVQKWDILIPFLRRLGSGHLPVQNVRKIIIFI